MKVLQVFDPIVEKLVLMILRQEVLYHVSYKILNRFDLDQLDAIFGLIRKDLHFHTVGFSGSPIRHSHIGKSVLVDLISGALRVENEEGRVLHRLANTRCERGNDLLCSRNALRFELLGIGLLCDTFFSEPRGYIVKHTVELGKNYGHWLVRVREEFLELFELFEFFEGALSQVDEDDREECLLILLHVGLNTL